MGKVWLIKLGATGPLVAVTETETGYTKPATIIQNEDQTFQLTGFIDLVNHHGQFYFPEIMFRAEPTQNVLNAYNQFFEENLPEAE